ncbi:hypothetical protein KTO58_19740 [Chitinophaga pendula]|uniref:hypothetical protein n=1 Tax=Chitinophaga TaxID=79328 RepID=UPI000BAF9CE7|nr:MULTISPECIES: hypothetical protein [Chitinophaga]ASZ11099.1 hypothetical protein CK934_09060 [Chitinophaga sp. MD30]UCJ05903.1 hypothetical protein KTO58_19740 [Chitinophaga pendula]
MYRMNWKVVVGSFKLGLVASIEIHKSVDLLADTAQIVLPGTAYNRVLSELENTFRRGQPVSIYLGYDDQLRQEFSGYVQSIATDDGSIKLNLEDEIYVTRVAVADKEFKNVYIKQVLEYLTDSIKTSLGIDIQINCTHTLRYDKFVISKATAFDVLKKLQEEAKANVYMKGNVLHFHLPYEELFGKQYYDFAHNIEKAELSFKQAADRRFEVEVEGITRNGKNVKVIVGTTGGDKRSIKIYGVSDPDTLRKRGEAELKTLVYDGYEGSITTWLLPYVEPAWAASIHDSDYEYKTGWYYVTAVTTTFSEAGAVRAVQLGIKLSETKLRQNG